MPRSPGYCPHDLAFAREGARAVVEALGTTTDPLTLSFLASALSALAGQLEPGEASAAARVVAEALGTTTDPDALSDLAEALSALAGRLEPRAASRQASAAAP